MQQRRLTDFFNSPSCLNESTYTGKLTMLNVSSTQSPISSPLSRKRKSRLKNDLHQTIIDAGQKKIGLQHCAKCGMVYNIDDKNDVEHHDAFHNRFTDKKCYRVTVTQIESWKGNLFWEEVKSPVEGIIFRLNGTSTATLRRKLEEIVKNFVNEEIGYCSDLPIWDNDRLRQALVFVSHSSKKVESPFIAGILLIDPVKTATLMPQKKHFQGQFLSANRVWVHTQLRRKGLATFLLDAACRLFTQGESLPRTRIAFNDPTDAGIQLARSYIGDKENGRFNLMKKDKSFDYSSTFSNAGANSHKCVLCSERYGELVEFLSEQEFISHLRSTHCSFEGGSYICRFEPNGVCLGTPESGLSSDEYTVHIQRYHLSHENSNVLRKMSSVRSTRSSSLQNQFNVNRY